jgi:4-hydroxy 2-oxovalerate aldolase
MAVTFLDCTLRDGAHVNSGKFGEKRIANIITGLTEASADIVEMGFLRNVVYSSDVTSFPVIEDAERILSDIPANPNVAYALMARADEYDISKLSECSGRIKLIRIAFYHDYLKKAVEFANKIKTKGYNFTLNLIDTPSNSLRELDKVAEYANEIAPYAINIVDTFGVLDEGTLSEIAENYDAKLNRNIRMGLHVHENLASAFSLVKGYIKYMDDRRDIVVDGSLMGIGRAPGNLCTELITDYLNVRHGKDFKLTKILELIYRDVAPIRQQFKWGYSPEFFLSAKYKVHRSYAEHLAEQQIPYEVIDRLLSRIEPKYALKFNKDYIDSLSKEQCGEQQKQ